MINKKIVFFISRCDEKSGLLRHIVNMANSLSEYGFQMELLTFSGVREEIFFPLRADVLVTSINGKASKTDNGNIKTNKDVQKSTKEKNISDSKKQKTKKSFLQGVLKSLKSIPAYKHYSIRKNYRKYFLASKPDIVVVWGSRRLSRAWYATRGINCKIFDAEFNSFEKTFPRDDNENNRILKRCNGMIVQTLREKELFTPYCSRIFVINNPIFNQLPQPFTGTRQKRIVNFCRISPQKNLGLLIESFELFYKENKDYSLHIYGDVSVDVPSDYSYLEMLVEMIKKKRLENAVFLHSSREDIHQVILDSAMFVSSSDFEGLSNSMLEAMAIGMPCICTDCMGGGTREVMIDHENGLIVPMKDKNEMFRAMKEFADNPELAKTCGRNATKIRELLSTDNIVKQWIKVLCE